MCNPRTTGTYASRWVPLNWSSESTQRRWWTTYATSASRRHTVSMIFTSTSVPKMILTKVCNGSVTRRNNHIITMGGGGAGWLWFPLRIHSKW